jgi:predicted PurR-regulated permease PerM
VRRNWALAVLGALILWFAWTVRSALNPLIAALLLAYILHPLVLRLERRGWSRQRAVNVIFGVAALGATLLGFALALQARSLWHDVVVERKSFEHIRDEIDGLVQSGSDWLGKFGIDLAPKTPAVAVSDPNAPAEAQEESGGATRALLDELYERVRVWVTNSENREGPDASRSARGGGACGPSSAACSARCSRCSATCS